MRIHAALRTTLLVLALFAVVASMRWLSAASGRQSLGALGFSDSAVPAKVIANGVDVDICPSRVHSITWDDGARMEEVGGLSPTWQMLSPRVHQLPYLEIERWLSLNCRPKALAVGRQSQIPDLKYQPFVSFEYVDGSTHVLEKTPTKLFRWQEQVFESEDLDKSLRELRSLDKTSDAP